MLTAYTFFVIAIIVLMILLSPRRPGLVAALMWSMFAVEQLLQQGNEFLIKRNSWINIALTLLACLTVLNSFRHGRYRGFRMPLEVVYMLLLLGMAALSYYWSISPKDTLEQYWKYLPYLVAFALVTPLVAVDDRQIRLAIDTTVFFGFLVLIGHAMSTYGYRGVILDSMWGKSVEGNPLAVATYAGYVGICGVFSAYGQRLNWIGLLRFGVMLLAGWLVIRSGSRGQLVGMAVVCVVWLPITTRATFKRSTIVALMMSVVLIALGVFLVERYEWSGRWSWEKIAEARSGRWQMAVDLLDYWSRSGVATWLFGLGNSSSFRIVGFYPHNTPFEILGEEGLVGFAFYMAFFLSALLGGMAMMFRKELAVESRMNLGVLLALFTFEFLLTLKQGSLLSDSMFLCFGCTIGIMMMVYRRRQPLAAIPQTRSSDHSRPVRTAHRVHRMPIHDRH